MVVFSKRVTVFFLCISLAALFFSLLGTSFSRGGIDVIIITVTLLLISQSIFTLLTMIFSWNDPHSLQERRSNKTFTHPQFRISALVPVREEAAVIGGTIRKISQINYPIELKQIIVICRSDDKHTIDVAVKDALLLEKQGHDITVLVSHKDVPNKPTGLNMGLGYATGEIITVFDAEDDPHPDIYNVVNTHFVQKKVDVVQCGVQLMNFRSAWYAALNCLEYYFWFKSSLHAFSTYGVIPLGGNTVFIRKVWLESIGGWNQDRLTEDADVGIRLSAAGAKMSVLYDEEHVTKEETPSDLSAFIKQRTRWNQGFLEILSSGEWWSLPRFSARFLTAYLLIVPLIQVLWLLYLPLTLFLLITNTIPASLALFSFIPGYILVIQLTVYVLGLMEFCREYKQRMPFWYPLKLIVVFFPYQLVLAASSVRATIRFLLAVEGWEKTAHFNLHRAEEL